MDTYIQSELKSGLSYKNEVKSILSFQQGAKYGFILEIQSPMGTYFCPVRGYKTKEAALFELRKGLK